MGYMYPVPKGTPKSQNFGASPGGVNPAGGHTGIDFACPTGTPIYAPADGVIAFEGWLTDPTGSNPWLLTDGGGIAIVLDAGDTAPTFIMAHLNESYVNTGQRVRKGDLIGRSGNTGKWTTGPHVHFEVMLPGFYLYSSTYGRSNPDGVCDHYKEDVISIVPAGDVTSSPSGNTRTVTTEGANVRTAPRADAPLAAGYPDGLALGATLAVVGYVKGQDVTGLGDNAWLKTVSGFYVWANGAGNNIDGLAYLGDMSAPAPAPAQDGNTRTVTDPVANVHLEPFADAPLAPGYADGLAKGATIVVTGYVKGQDVSGRGDNAWYQTKSGYYVWANAAGDSLEGLAYLGEKTRSAPAPAPAPAPTPAPPAYTFQAACALVTEVRPAAEGKFQRGGMPAQVTGLVVHQFIAGETRFDVHLDSVVRTFTEGERVASAHFGVEGKRVVQFVDLKDRAYHAGPAGNDFWSIEVYGGMDVETLATVALLIHELNKLAGRSLELHRHKELMATQCGTDVPLESIKAAVADLDNPATPTPDPVQPVPPSPVPDVTVPDKEAVLREFFEKLIDEVLDDTK